MEQLFGQIFLYSSEMLRKNLCFTLFPLFGFWFEHNLLFNGKQKGKAHVPIYG